MTDIDIVMEDARWEAAQLPDLAQRAGDHTLVQLGLEAKGYSFVILACDDARIKALNAEFRGKPTSTNVLSWPSEDLAAERDGEAPHPPSDPELGDIAIAYETCAHEARELGKSLPDHATHLIVHGLLHLLGYDHMRDADATLMEQLERDILGLMGLPDPYKVDDGA